MSGGAFDQVTREAVLTRCHWRCVGCGSAHPLTVQHRVARGMGGRARAGADLTSHPANGLALCGSGTTGCHGWVERHPEHASTLGWRIASGSPVGAPYLWPAPGSTWEWVSVDDDGSLVYEHLAHNGRAYGPLTGALAEYRQFLHGGQQ
jgi:hypothetical protein